MFRIKNLSLTIRNQILLKEIHLEAKSNQITGLIGRSGSGKSTLFRLALGLLPKAKGYHWKGQMDWNGITLGKEMNPKLQPVFQDPFGSFSPFGTMGELLLEPIRIQKNLLLNHKEKTEAENQIKVFCEKFDLPISLLSKTKQELSGGQLQRFAILRAILLKPEFLLLDEPVTALDVLVQKKIAEELKSINLENKLGMLIVSHDLGFLSYMCDEIFVLEDGVITEFGNPKLLLKDPKSNLLKELIQSRDHSFGGATSSSESSN